LPEQAPTVAAECQRLCELLLQAIRPGNKMQKIQY
jgi:hypothetical protein